MSTNLFNLLISVFESSLLNFYLIIKELGMEKDDEKFFYEDEVAMVSPKSGMVKYGLIVTTNRSRSETELKKTSCKNPNDVKVIWHPNGNEEILSDDKVCALIVKIPKFLHIYNS